MHQVKQAIVLITAIALAGCATTAKRSEDISILSVRDTVPLETRALDERSPLKMHFFNVGQGDSILVTCPDSTTILVDAGTSRYPQAPEPPTVGEVREMLLEALDGRMKIDTAVLTHQDSNHYRYIPKALSSFRAGQVVHAARVSDFDEYDMDDWLRALPQEKLHAPNASDYDPPGQPSSLIRCGEADVYMLAVNTLDDGEWSKNGSSVVLKITYGEFDAILTGDATFATESEIRDRYSDDWLDVELLEVGHHGSKSTSTG